MKKPFRIVAALLGLVLAMGIFAACGGSKNFNTDWDLSDAPVKKITYHDSLPESPAPVDRKLYDYDDMTQKYTIEIMGSHYGVEPPLDDPIEKYMETKYNIDLEFTQINGGDFGTTMSTRFADQDYPDMIILPVGNLDLMQDFGMMDQLMDAEIPLSYMPNMCQYVTEEYYDHGTYDGTLWGVPKYQQQCDYNLFIRTDWLAEFKMEMPKTMDELYQYALKCKEVKGEYFMTSANYGGLFGMMEKLKPNYGHPGFNVKDGKINHPIIDGTEKKFLTFLNNCMKNGLIHPDWETMTWESMKSLMMNDHLGMVDYPASLYVEYWWIGQNKQGTSYKNWAPLPPLDSGFAAPAATPAFYFIFPKKMYEEPGKLKRICHMIDQCLYTGDDYFNTIQGGGNDVFGKEVCYIAPAPEGKTYYKIYEDKHPYMNGEKGTSTLSLLTWQNIGLSDLYHRTYDPDYPEYSAFYDSKYDEIRSYPRWQNYFKIKLDNTDLATMSSFMNQEYVKFAKGTRSLDEWDLFVRDWKTKYKGEKLLNEAADQLGVGHIN